MNGGWERQPLSSVVTIQGGGTPATDQPAFWNGDIPWISPKDMKAARVGSSIDRITLQAVQQSATSLVPIGSVLLVVRSGILARTIPVALTTRELTINQDIKALRPLQGISSEFLYYFLKASETELLARVTKGATVHRLLTEAIRSLVIPLPPFSEQKRIVAILDEAFEGISTAIANTEKNLANARELYRTVVESRLVTASGNWKVRPIRDLVRVQSGFAFKSADYRESGHFLVRIGNVQDGRLTLDNPKYVGLGADTSRFELNAGDILVSLTGNIGRVAIVEAKHLPAALNQRVARIENKNVATISTSFLFLVLSLESFRESLSAAGHGAAQQNVSPSAVGGILIHYPILSVQATIVKDIEKVSTHVRHLEGLYHKKMEAYSALKNSVLQRAFSGGFD